MSFENRIDEYKGRTLALGFRAFAGAAFAAAVTAACSAGEEAVEQPGSLEQALACDGSPECPDATQTYCDDGRWPNGVIRYKFASGMLSARRTMIRQAMNDWESLTHGAIQFFGTTATSTATNPVITIQYGGGNGAGYLGCVANPGGCIASMQEGNVYHELGHCIGPNGHHWQRYDARHYWRSHDTAGIDCNQGALLHPGGRCSIPARDNLMDYGPFDYRSTMLNAVTHPDHTRWDGSAISPGATCPGGSPQSPPPGCPGGPQCPTCTTCGLGQPYGFPTAGDASAVVESYRSAAEPGWGKFLRTVEEATTLPGSKLPFDYNLASTDRIPREAAPALETWGGDSLGIYVRGVSNTGVSNIWKKYLDVPSNTWTNWWSLGRPAGSTSTALSDPAVVSWGPGRTDLAVTFGTAVYIRTDQSGTWTAWASLGTPPSPAASSPAISSWGPNRLDVFVRGSNDALYTKKCTANCVGNTGTWSAWTQIPGGTFRGKPAAVSTSAGIDVYVHGMDDRLWSTVTADGQNWTGYSQLLADPLKAWDPSCPECSSPAASSRANATRWDVFVRGVDDQMLVTTYAGGYGPYRSLGGVAVSAPAAVARGRSEDRTEVLLNMGEEHTAGDVRYGVWIKPYRP